MAGAPWGSGYRSYESLPRVAIPEKVASRLCDNLPHYLTMDIGEPEIPPGIAVR